MFNITRHNFNKDLKNIFKENNVVIEIKYADSSSAVFPSTANLQQNSAEKKPKRLFDAATLTRVSEGERGRERKREGERERYNFFTFKNPSRHMYHPSIYLCDYSNAAL